jgi:outer membrane protein OmpA-like peptidoglycan-associated protein
MPMHPIRLLLAVVGMLLLAGPAFGQTINPVETAVVTQLFEPAIGAEDTLMTVEPASVAGHLAFGVGLMFNYQRKPLVIYREREEGGGGGGMDLDDAEEIVVVANQMTADLGGAVGLHHKWLHAQVGLALPINLLLQGNEIDQLGNEMGDLSASGIGDLRLQLKVALLREMLGWSLAFSPIITFPTGRDSGFGGDPNLTFRPRVVADYRSGDFLVAANLGLIVRENATIACSQVGDRLTYGLGGAYRAHSRVRLIAELFGQAGFSTTKGCQLLPDGRIQTEGNSANDLDAFPLELGFGGRFGVGRGLHISAGTGFGLIKAIGSPQFRLIAGLNWAPDFTDTDHDGIYDQDDSCPTQPEDPDGFEDKNGCPDLDNDQDLIPDVRDRCPMEAEDKDTFQDEDGCPDADNDGDGIPDLKDGCPFKPETKNGFKDDDGCPDVPDKDGDGVADTDDKCPNEPEDLDKFQDEDGCPDPDNDNDGVPDQFDDCPVAAEDVDGFQDDNGCPDPDNDRDGVPDAQDKCPDKPETINGVKDDDGCPDKGKTNVIVKENKIVITQRIYFATNKATIKRRSYSILNQVALVLKANPQIKGVRVEGHTDSRGKPERNKVLSQQRAESVRDYVIAQGIEPARLFAVGYGPERPIADNKTRQGRADNRRVEFVILEQAPGTQTK